MLLLFLHRAEFFFFEDFHLGRFKCRSTKRRQQRFDFPVKNEKLIILHKRFLIYSRFDWDVLGCGGFRRHLVGLTANRVVRRFVSQFFDELVRLNVDVLATVFGFGRVHVSREELLRLLHILK